MNTDSQNINKSLFSSEKLVFIGSAFWWFSLYIYVPILPIFSKDLGANLGFVGLIVASYSIGQILFRMPIGYLSDRLKSRKLFSVFAALVSTLGSSFLFFADQPNEVFIGRTITGIAAAGWVAISVYYSSFFSPKERSKSSTYILGSNTASVFLGTFLSGFVSDLFGANICFLISILSGLAATLLFTLSKENKFKLEAKFSTTVFFKLMRNRILIAFCTIGILVQFVTFSTLFSFFPIYLNELNFTDSIVGNIVSFSTLATLVGTFSSPILLRKFGFWRTAAIASIPLALSNLLTPFLESLSLLIILRLIAGFGSGVVFSSLMGLIVREFQENYQASAMGIFQAIYAIGMFSGPLISGMIASNFGISYVFAFSSFISLTILMVCFVMRTEKLTK
ncbi:MAG: MFS transporter [SAR202 cluster bacterium]|nr:MFS transporter [SAR202 cluster bacterium]|tara:strand:+ start:54 stop:1235 length:1182 start_codon:yes stop_codon:yes gene_type:complete